uniref:Cell wall hydrolase SleB domain-containing protein n=1 Tax=Panagrolaimus davidi TaxID=227884 RepID=A0A914P6K6_9BILA
MPIYNIDDHDLDILKKTVFMEARGEPADGQAAVVYVIVTRARLNKPYWGGSKIADVCLKPGQFECWNSSTNIDTQSQEYRNIENIVNDVIYNGAFKEHNDGSDHYNNPDKEGYPDWTNNCDKTKRIGGHQFYKTKPGF